MDFSSSYHLLFSYFLFINLFLFFPSPTLSGPISVPSIAINFTASYLQFIDNSGAFLASQNNFFQARITNSKPESTSFYFVIIHVLSHTIIWSANRNHPISQSSQLRLSENGLTLYNDTGHHPIWSTPAGSSVSFMQLLDSGNLVLLDHMNKTVWESFDFPTDVLVVGQKLRIGESLVSSSSDVDLSESRYKLVIGDNDAMLQWNGMTYWKLSMDKNAFRDTSFAIDYMIMNSNGVYLMGGNGKEIVLKVILNDVDGLVSANSSNFRMVKVDHNGVFSVVNINSIDRTSEEVFRGPADICQVPFTCGRLGVCTNGGSCGCPPPFRFDPKMNNSNDVSCVTTDTSLVLPSPCNGSSSLSSNDTAFIKYLSLRNDLDYFSNQFMDAVIHDVNLVFCQNLCSRNCSCLGVYYSQGTGSCYMIQNYLGSTIIKSSSTNRFGYIKAIVVGNPNHEVEKEKSDLPVVAVILLPTSGVLIIIIATLIWLRMRRRKWWNKRANSKMGRSNSWSSSFAEGEFDFVSIPGLPIRFDYEELAVATEGFKTQIGCGGFGTVYKGTLKDGTDIAVKKITCLGAQGKREFLTEIAVIGNIHHVNLVRLKGFCTHGGQKLLVYEFMKRGSLDRSLFRGGEHILEWKERHEIALGTARGLAYLHSGCEHKIIHCDVKPENILLHEKSQVKISDFGLSKLLSPEQSGLFTTLRGTRGYLAPEWLTSSAISDKTDVYSYGMVLLEIIRGQKNSSAQTQSNNCSGTDHSNVMSSSPSSGGRNPRLIYFPLFALEMHEERRYLELVDPRLAGQVTNGEVEKLVRVALCCVHEEPNLRPSMSNVVGMLEGAVPLGEPQMESLNFLRFYGRRFTEISTLEDQNSKPNELMLCREPETNTTTTTSSYSCFSHMSSQQVSGPR